VRYMTWRVISSRPYRVGISAKATRRFSLTSVEGVEPDADAWVESQAGGC